MSRFVIALLVAVSCSSVVSADSSQSVSSELSIGIDGTASSQVLRVVKREHPEYFEEVRLKKMPNNVALIEAFKSGEVQVAALGLETAIKLYEQGYKSRVLFVTSVSNGSTVLLSRDGQEIEPGNQEKLKIAIRKNFQDRYFANRITAILGFQSDSYEIYETDLNSYNEILTGQNDFVFVEQLPISPDFDNFDYEVISSSRRIPMELVNVLVMNAEFYRANHDAVHELIDPLVVLWINHIEALLRNDVIVRKNMAQEIEISMRDLDTLLDNLILADSKMQDAFFRLDFDEKSSLLKVADFLQQTLLNYGELSATIDIGALSKYNYIEEIDFFETPH